MAPAKKPIVRVIRSCWDENGVRHDRGAVIEVDVAMAKAWIAAGAAERADPLPGEE